MKMKKYKCITDLQGGDFAVGVTDTVQGGKEAALEWAFSDGNYSLIEHLGTLEEHEIIKFIEDFGDILLVEIKE